MISPESDHAEQARWFANEVRPHEASLRSYLHGAFPAVRDVDDVVQESYLRIWKSRAAEPVRSAKSFLFKVARRLAIDLVRRDHRSPVSTIGNIEGLDISSDAHAPGDSVSRSEKIQLLIEAIDALPPKCRQVVILRKLKFLSQREAAARLGISEKGVEIQLARGVARCREHLRSRGVNGFLGHES